MPIGRLALTLAVLGATSSLRAQETGPGASVPSVTVLAGVGNAMGWFGAQAERYVARGRLSGFAGLGYTPSWDPGDPSGVTVAGGLRGFTRGRRHRGLLELSVCQVAVYTSSLGNDARRYGPGVQAGYQYVSRGGFSFLVSLGLGYSIETPAGFNAVQPLFGLGFGYTWRQPEP
jgi:hypothetical protein